MDESLRDRVRAKLLRQLSEDGETAPVSVEEDDPRLVEIGHDLGLLDRVPDGDPLIDELAAKYWVP